MVVAIFRAQDNRSNQEAMDRTSMNKIRTTFLQHTLKVDERNNPSGLGSRTILHDALDVFSERNLGHFGGIETGGEERRG